ncbi:Unsaturated chondroitin disaccharide hydrolase [compost metagenome]
MNTSDHNRPSLTDSIHSKFLEAQQLDAAWIQSALSHVLHKIDQNLERLGYAFPSASTINSKYSIVEGAELDWTEGFWTGMLWLAYEVTGKELYRKTAEKHVEFFLHRIQKQIKTNTHDLGFLYSLSCVSAYKLTGNEHAKQAALLAADLLASRFHPKAGIIQAWGDLNNPLERGRMIIDCNLNLPLLYWASEVTGERKYYDIANNHIKQASRYIVREDYSTFHTYHMNVETGTPVKGSTHQGYSDDSCWARGQAWGIYGFTLNYLYLNDNKLLELACHVTDYFLDRLPEDLVCYWDLLFTEGNEQQRDSSSAAIAACGMLEMVKHFPLLQSEKANAYTTAALSIIKSLGDHYVSGPTEEENGILLHSVYNKPRGIGIDESCLWGDYYYFEALVRLTKDWNVYW